MGIFVADFETTTDKNNCRVWSFGVTEVGNPENTIIGLTLDEFMTWCQTRKNEKGEIQNDTVFFHNLKFDSQFIIPWCFRNSFDHTTKKEDRKSKTFNTMINHKNFYYKVEVIFQKSGKKINKVVFQDSLKLIPMSVKDIAKAFHLPFKKGKIDYHRHNNLPEGSPITEKEKEYLINDVQIVAHAIDYFHSQGLNKMTIGACAMDDFKLGLSKGNKKYMDKVFRRFFPIPSMNFHLDVKDSYKGGFTYLNPKFAGKTVGEGLVFDVNSLYPSVMVDSQLPFDVPQFGEGEYVYDPVRPLYVQRFSCIFDLKKGKLPTIQLKKYGRQYLTSSNDVEEVLTLNNVDLELFFEHYDVKCLEYECYWKFKSTEGFFTDYIEKWSAAKIKAKDEKNHGLYLISKLFLNSLYGKFGSDNKEKNKIPHYSPKDDIVYYEDSDPVEKEGVYIAMASFITSYARLKTIKAAQKVMDNYHNKVSKAQFCYCDTDSLHIYLNGESPESFIASCGLDVSDTKLGAWKLENTFTKAKFLRAKCYMEKLVISEKQYLEGIEEELEELELEKDNLTLEEYEKRKKQSLFSKDDEHFYMLNITVAGMPADCYSQVTFNNFKIGQSYKGRKTPTIVPGGVVLSDIDFTIKEH